jgi:hypothetical protein
MADTSLSNAFISLNDVINNFLISYTGPGKLIPDAVRTEVVFHARRCLQEFAYETLKSQFTEEEATFTSPLDFPTSMVAIISITVGAIPNVDTLVETSNLAPAVGEYYVDYASKQIVFNATDVAKGNLVLKYLSNALTTDESAAIPKLAEEALYSCMVYAILANRGDTRPDVLQRLLIEKTDKLETAKSRLVFTNFD